MNRRGSGQDGGTHVKEEEREGWLGMVGGGWQNKTSELIERAGWSRGR